MRNEQNNIVASDIKLIFDSLRNVGIASVIFYGSTYIDTAFEKIAPFDMVFAVITILISLYLYGANIWWLFYSLQAQPNSKVLHYIGGIILVVLTTFAFAGSQYKEVLAIFNT